MLGSIRERRLFFIFLVVGGYSSFLTYLYSSIRLMGHGNSVWGFGDILTATAH